MAESINVVIEGVEFLQELAPTEEGPRMWDVELRHDSGVTLRAHNLILSEHSAFFREAFADKSYVDLKEKEDGVSLGTLRAVLNSIYRIPFKVDAQNVYEVLSTANYLQVEQICDDCCAFLKSRLSVENAFSIWQNAFGREFRGSLDLQGACAGFIFENFKDICNREDFTELKPEELKALLSHRPASRMKESVVVDAVITWLNKTWTANFQEAFGVLETINWNKVRQADLAKMKSVQEYELMKCGSSEEKPFKLDVLELLLAPPRSGSSKQFSKIVALSLQGLRNWKMSEYDLAAGEWTSRLSDLSLEIVEQEYVLNAFAFQGCVVVVYVLFALPSFIPRAHVFKQGRIHASIPFSIPDDIHASGGTVTFSDPFFCLRCSDERARATKIILYDARQLLPAHEEVSEISTIPVHQTIVTDGIHAARTEWSKAIYFDDEVYLISGNKCNKVSVFSLSDNAWHRGASTHTACCNIFAYLFAIGEVLYFVGGGETHDVCNKTFARFDPASATEGWVKGPDLVKGCEVQSHYFHDGRLFLVGVGEAALGGTSANVIQSIDMGDFFAGWRDDTAFFKGLNPKYAFAV